MPNRLSCIFSYKLIAISFCCLLLACHKPDPPVTIAANNWPGYTLLHLARDKQYFDVEKVRLIELPSASEVIHALRSGTIDGAALTLDEALTIIDDGFDLTVILIFDYSNGGDVLLSKPEITSMNELRGKKIAVEYTAVGAMVLDAALQSIGLRVDDIEIEKCMLDHHIECYEKADAVVTFEPKKTILLRKGARQLFDSSHMSGRIIDVLVVSQEIVEERRSDLEHLVKGYYKGLNFFEQHTDEALDIMSNVTELSREELRTAYKGLIIPSLEESKQLFVGSPSIFEKKASNLAALMYERRLVKNLLNKNSIVAPSFIKAVDK